MRWLVLLFGLLGVAGAGYLGTSLHRLLSDETNRENLAKNRQEWEHHRDALPPAQAECLDTEVARGERQVRMSPVVFLGLLLGLVGTVLGFCRYRWSGALLLASAGLVPGLFFVLNLLFTGALVLAAYFCLFVDPA